MSNRSSAHILVLTRYARRGASSRIRHFDIMGLLEEKGFTFDCLPLLDDEAVTRFYEGRPRAKGPLVGAYLKRLRWLVAPRPGYDLIWIEKEALPWLPWVVERLAYRRSDCATVVDFDDNWPARYDQHSSSLMRQTGRTKFQRLLAAADAVTAANPVLARTLAALGGREVDVIYNGIDVDRYARAGRAGGAATRHDAGLETSATGEPMRIGWIGTPFTAAEHLPQVWPMLNRLQAEGVATVVLVGAGEAVPGLNARRLPWSEQTELEDIAHFDVGIMPLGDTQFDQGKSGWKLVQCMAAGRPVVASAVGFNIELVADAGNGFLATDADRFEQRLRQLAADPALRRRLGQAAQDSLRERYGLPVTVERTALVLRRAMAVAGKRSRPGSRLRRSVDRLEGDPHASADGR